jgi:multiple sugar transport system ATP-binding protein
MALDTPSPATVLETRALQKSYGAVHILRDISVSMGKGEFLVLVGPSGCGKSTLLNCIAGLEETTGGSLMIGGRDVTEVPPRDRDIAMVFQSYALYPTMSVADNIGFGMRIRRTPKPEMQTRIAEVAQLLQIDHLLDRRPSQLSGGQRQRVAMGRALVRQPALFLFDEPLSNLDAKLRVEMRAEIKRLHRTTGASIVYVTHDQVEAMTLATRIVVLKDGIVQQVGTPEDIYDRPSNTFVADFMGSPPMNLIPATVSQGMITAEGLRINAPADTDLPAKVLVGLRPEHLSLAKAGGDLTVVPTMVESTGAETYVQFMLAGRSVTARLPGRLAMTEGDSVALNLDRSALCLFDPDTGLRIAPVVT